jgi:hypothetical protein
MFTKTHIYKGNDMVAEFNPTFTKYNKTEIEALIVSYDWYTAYIDDGNQHKMAERENKRIVELLREYGCEKFELIDEEGSIERKII